MPDESTPKKRKTPYEDVLIWRPTYDVLGVLADKWSVTRTALIDAAVEIAMDFEERLIMEAVARTPSKGRRAKRAGKLRRYYVESPGANRRRDEQQRIVDRDYADVIASEEKERASDGGEV